MAAQQSRANEQASSQTYLDPNNEDAVFVRVTRRHNLLGVIIEERSANFWRPPDEPNQTCLCLLFSIQKKEEERHHAVYIHSSESVDMISAVQYSVSDCRPGRAITVPSGREAFVRACSSAAVKLKVLAIPI